MNTVSLYNNDFENITLTPAEATMRIKTPDHEEGFGLIVVNNGGSEKTLTIKGGNSIFSAGDMPISLADGYTLVSLKNTGRYKNVSGEDAGYIVIEIDSPDGIEICPFEI